MHDPCNYGRKGQKAFGHGYFEEPRWITQQCCEHYVEMYPNRMNNFCCGAGGGAWAMPYNKSGSTTAGSRPNRSGTPGPKW